MLFCSNQLFDLFQGASRIFNSILKRNFVNVARFKAFVIFRRNGDGVDNDVSPGNVLRR